VLESELELELEQVAGRRYDILAEEQEQEQVEEFLVESRYLSPSSPASPASPTATTTPTKTMLMRNNKNSNGRRREGGDDYPTTTKRPPHPLAVAHVLLMDSIKRFKGVHPLISGRRVLNLVAPGAPIVSESVLNTPVIDRMPFALSDHLYPHGTLRRSPQHKQQQNNHKRQYATEIILRDDDKLTRQQLNSRFSATADVTVGDATVSAAFAAAEEGNGAIIGGGRNSRNRRKKVGGGIKSTAVRNGGDGDDSYREDDDGGNHYGGIDDGNNGDGLVMNGGSSSNDATYNRNHHHPYDNNSDSDEVHTSSENKSSRNDVSYSPDGRRVVDGGNHYDRSKLQLQIQLQGVPRGFDEATIANELPPATTSSSSSSVVAESDYFYQQNEQVADNDDYSEDNNYNRDSEAFAGKRSIKVRLLS
jgi:hypothetical protein